METHKPKRKRRRTAEEIEAEIILAALENGQDGNDPDVHDAYVEDYF